MLRPVDMNLTIQHAADAHRAGGGDSNAARPEVASQMFADRLEKQARLQEQQVIQSNKSEKNDINSDRKGNGSGYNANRRARQKKAVASKTPKYAGESLFDVTV